MTQVVTIDGSQGEGGGQVLRTSLALSLVTGKPFHIQNIRAGRGKPGMMRQHLTAAGAAVEVGRAEMKGCNIQSRELVFTPGEVLPGNYHFAVGTAGSATLVFQTILPALITVSCPSEIVLEGGTHNPYAPPFDFLALAFIPVLRRMGIGVSLSLERAGFFPAGGGRFTARIEPVDKPCPVDLIERGEIKRQIARAVVSRLPRKIADRELAVVRDKLGWNRECLKAEEVRGSFGPGNILTIVIESQNITEVFTGFGMKSVPAEKVAEKASRDAEAYLAADVPVGPHLCDQLLIPFALAGAGKFKTTPLTRHAATNIEIIKKFLDVDFRVEKTGNGLASVEVIS